MSDAKPTSSGKPSRGIIVMGALAAVGVVLWVAQGPGEQKTAPRADDYSDASAWRPQEFDLTPDPNFKAGVPLRPMDKDIFAAMKDPTLTRERALDLWPDRSYRVRLIGSVPEHYFATVMIDLTRDGQGEERWTLKGGDIQRYVPHDPNANGPMIYTLAHGRWQLH